MGQHRAFWKTRRPRCVLNIDRVIRFGGASALLKFIGVDVLAEFCRNKLAGLSFRRDNSAPIASGDPKRVSRHCSLESLGSGYVGVSVLERLVQQESPESISRAELSEEID